MNSSKSLENALRLVLNNWHHLVNYPEHHVPVRSMIGYYIPGLIDAYLKIPGRNDPRAVEDLVSAFGLLEDKSMKIFNAIQQEGRNNLEDHGRELRSKFVHLPDDIEED
ncbi:hypothetical protein CDES_06805 [Corynebacterium deserti GIMN1.010]|uniref:Uncharacterized protein n=1 Tax=Corynebacterium deserti GIMN1.010 TaxID=931089 RepID=A0A0M4CDT8_9CORY|nr:hypothetical protein [Corynebacterium deserti]ALC05778.1 hypothetical protein CDES_06805 [Corynebacterium deserti GIMN1.010]